MDRADPYANGSPFTRIFSDPDRVRILDILLSRGSLSISRDRLEDLTGVASDDIQTHITVLEHAGLASTTEDGDYRLAETTEAEALQRYHLYSYDETMEAVIAATDTSS